jgi:hypothetical protein
MMVMADNVRDKIIDLDRQRLGLRSTLAGDMAQAQHDLHPRTLVQRWTDRKRAQISDLAEDGRKGLKKNAPMIGLASAVILLFAARRPISKAVEYARQKGQQKRDNIL